MVGRIFFSKSNENQNFCFLTKIGPKSEFEFNFSYSEYSITNFFNLLWQLFLIKKHVIYRIREKEEPQYWRTSFSGFCCYIYPQVALHTYIHDISFSTIESNDWSESERSQEGGGPWLIFIFILCYMAWKVNLILKLSKCQKLKPQLTNGWLTFE